MLIIYIYIRPLGIDIRLCLEAFDFAYLQLKIHTPSLSVCHPGMQPHLEAFHKNARNKIPNPTIVPSVVPSSIDRQFQQPTTNMTRLLTQRHQSQSISFSFIIKAAVIAIKTKYEDDMLSIARSGRFAIRRERRSVHQIYLCLGPSHFRRAYRMNYDTFWRLHQLLKPHMVVAFEMWTRYKKKGGRE